MSALSPTMDDHVPVLIFDNLETELGYIIGRKKRHRATSRAPGLRESWQMRMCLPPTLCHHR
jgi:hypothetical protein